MKPSKSIRSFTSFKSPRSIRTQRDSIRGGAAEELIDLVTMLPMVCGKLQCPYDIIVKKEQQQETEIRQRRKTSNLPTPATVGSQQIATKKTSDAGKDRKPSDTESLTKDNAVTISAVYDEYNCLIEILLNEIKVPRVLMQVIALFVPYFRNLTSLKIQQCSIDFYTLHEISKILTVSTINNIIIDNSPMNHSYEMILNEKSNLRCLSICKCKLNDDDCKLIAAKLLYGESADNLQVLNLSSNNITDVGAKYISDALRSNRRLRYLSLADNCVNDYGAGCLLDVLIEFPLTCDEIFDMRTRYMKYVKWKQALYSKYLNERDRSFDDLSEVSRKSAKRRSAIKDKVSHQRAELLANEILGEFTDPFDANAVKFRDDYYYCAGNMVLCYLNMAYNNLSFLTVKKLIKVVMYQNVKKKGNETGLVKVVIEGNNLPICQEINILNELLDGNIKNFAFKFDSKRMRSKFI